MDFEATISAIVESLPIELDEAFSQVTGYIPEELSGVIRNAYHYFPTEINFTSAALFMLYFAAASLILGVTGRVVLGKRSSLNHSLSSVIGIFLIYAVTVVVYTFKPWQLSQWLSPLPFVTFAGEYLIVLPIMNTAFPALCTEILSLVILAFLVNLIDSLLPRDNSIVVWYLLRIVSVAGSMALHYVVRWAFRTYLPDFLVTYAPTALLFVLLFMLFSGFATLILGLILSISSPFLGAMCSFFFSSLVGKQVSKAVFTTAVLLAVFYLLAYAGYTVISITAASLLTYIPMVLILLVLWYLVGHLL